MSSDTLLSMTDDDMLIEHEPVGSQEHGLHFPEQLIPSPSLQERLKPSSQRLTKKGLECVHTRSSINNISKLHGRQLTLGEISDTELDDLIGDADIVWLMGIYKPSLYSRSHAIKYIGEYRYALPDITENEVVASPFAIPDYSPNPLIAKDWDEWDSVVERLNKKGKKVFLDFVPNHTAVDHPWAKDHPEYYIQGTPDQYQTNPDMYVETLANDGKIYYLAHGKDPNYPEWSDTLQLNYAKPQVQTQMKQILFKLAQHSDGVRCDMAMLLNASTFIRTWGDHLTEEDKRYIENHNFWKEAIPQVKEYAKTMGKDDFAFVAEAYWDKEELGQSFDYIYGKEIYDHLRRIIKDHEPAGQNLKNHIAYIQKAVSMGRHYWDLLFSENHDEERAVKEFGREPSKAVATLLALIKGPTFLLNQGQDEGRRIRPPMQVSQFPDEAVDKSIKEFYERLFRFRNSKLFQEGDWKMIETQNDNIIAYQISANTNQEDEVGAMVCINMGNVTAATRIKEIVRKDPAYVYRLSRGDLVGNPDVNRFGGMYLELIPWETQIVFYEKAAAQKQELPIAA